MEVALLKANLTEAAVIHEMQLKAFRPLLDKYRDHETSPANEPIDQIMTRLNQPFTDYYIINYLGKAAGAIRIVKKQNKEYRVSPIFILPEHQGKGIAQKVFSMIEEIYSDAIKWELDTILQEQGNCYLYEKLGYRQTGASREINRRMTIVYYEKNRHPGELL
ncbi:GNAT family N-acetyltransferase [Cohnella sp. 56]|uniref:GNAT family N-acetyltransferase n=1 Tax=Cohnella sp. 56 TaxID=3113722 RepID=UPI0030E89E41